MSFLRAKPISFCGVWAICLAISGCQNEDRAEKPSDSSTPSEVSAHAAKVPEAEDNPNIPTPSTDANHLASACLHASEGCAHEAGPTDQQTGHFGDAFTVSQPRELADVLTSDASDSETPIRVRGTIRSVCQRRGCWMVIADGDATARVVMKGGAFSVPREGQGRSAEVEGILRSKTLSAAQVAHLADDAGQANANPQATREFILTASAIEIR